MFNLLQSKENDSIWSPSVLNKQLEEVNSKNPKEIIKSYTEIEQLIEIVNSLNSDATFKNLCTTAKECNLQSSLLNFFKTLLNLFADPHIQSFIESQLKDLPNESRDKLEKAKQKEKEITKAEKKRRVTFPPFVEPKKVRIPE